VNGSKEDDALQVEGGVQTMGGVREYTWRIQEVAWAHTYQDQGEVIPT